MPEKTQIFDNWSDKYERWFATPLGKIVRDTEMKLLLEYLAPVAGERILDAGCGTGIFTTDFLVTGARVVGMDISAAMLEVASRKAKGMGREKDFLAVTGNILDLPFLDGYFDKVISNTALEFIADGEKALRELFRVLKPGGVLVIATLNRLSPWAEERTRRARRGETDLYDKAYFRSPQELLALAPVSGEFRTVVHFFKDEEPEKAQRIEQEGIAKNLDTGAFLVAKWVKPA
ncbi:MAG: class I SAM-dependent methyltransferase [Deltaproteobacteria bacterium]|nr:class I SAM-dependent methyltransferase [Deltaproteobacteria bacterium]